MTRRGTHRPLAGIFRLGRGTTLRIRLRSARRGRGRRLLSSIWIVWALAGLIAVGTVLLMLPLAGADGRSTPFLIAFFTATSAACTAGLVVVDTADHWSLFGQVVLLLLFQIGGLGFLTSSTLILLVLGRRLGLRDRLLVREALGEGTLAGLGSLVRRIVRFALIVEVAGAILLTAYFMTERSPLSAVWYGIFYSVSAFTNASFDLSGGFLGLSEEASNVYLLAVLSALVIIGGISYAVVADLRRVRHLHDLSLDSKLVLVTTGVLLVAGTAGVYLLERSNAASLASMSVPEALLQSFFFSVSARSSGFQTMSPDVFDEATLLLLIGLMFIGGAAGSTAGGIKVNSVGVLAAAVLSAVKGRPHVVAFWREIPVPVVMRALTVAVLALVLVSAAAFLLTLNGTFRYLPLLFEVTSAFGTVGMSTGITPALETEDRLVLIAMMFIGRLGPLTLAVALTRQQEDERVRHPEAFVRIG
ncbi:MAG: TrkH family potassium uptake protein [Dehalococcoidia bacterium]